MFIFFVKLDNVVGRVVYRFSNGLGCHMPCESLDEFWETEIHSRAHDGCHVSTFSGRGVTILLVSEPDFLNKFEFESSGYR